MAKKINVAALRKRLKLSQAAMAEKLGVNQATVCRLEKGQTPSGSTKLLLEILAKS